MLLSVSRGMKHNLIVITFLTIFGLTCQAQNKDIAHILDYYFYINDQISLEKYWVNEMKFNALAKEINSSRYHVTERYFYNFRGDGEPLLRSVTLKASDSIITYYSEYIFDLDGEFVLYVELQNDEEKYNYRRLRVFFKEEELLEWQVGKEHDDIVENKPDKQKVNKLLLKAAALKEKFEQQMEENIDGF